MSPSGGGTGPHGPSVLPVEEGPVNHRPVEGSVRQQGDESPIERTTPTVTRIGHKITLDNLHTLDTDSEFCFGYCAHSYIN